MILHWDGTAISAVPTPDLPGSASLVGVVALAPNDLWAVGTFTDFTNVVTRPLFEHWNGSAWSIVPAPVMPSGDNELFAVSAVSPHDIWAVGQHCDDYCYFAPPHPLAMHYDGSHWSVVPTPDLAPNYARFYSVTARSKNDAWAVGFSATSYLTHQTLTEHWDGRAWSVTASPNPGAGNDLFGVAAQSPHKVWAVGNYSTATVAPALVEQYSPDCR